MSEAAATPSVPLDQPQKLSETISSIALSADDARFDASFYAPAVVAAQERVEAASDELVSLGAVSEEIWYPGRFRRIWADPAVGVPLLGGTEIFHLCPASDKYLSRTQTPEIDKLRVDRRDLLVTRSGSVGRVTVAGDRLRDSAISEHVIRVNLSSAIPWGYVGAYLVSASGKLLLRRGTFGANVPEVEPSHLEAVPIPRLPSIEPRVHELFEKAVVERDRGAELLGEADARLLELLDVPPFEMEAAVFLPTPRSGLPSAPNPRAFTVGSSEIRDRLDGSFHVPIAHAAVRGLRAGTSPLERLGDFAGSIYVAPRFARIYVDASAGVPFLQGRSVPQYRPIDLQHISRAHTAGLSRWIVSRDTVLVTCSGTIGRVGLVTEVEDGWAASQHIMRIQGRAGVSDAGFIGAFLRNAYGQHQLKAKIYGGVVDEITEADTAETLIPSLPLGQQKEIGRIFREAYRRRDDANAREDEAVAQIDRLIGAAE